MKTGGALLKSEVAPLSPCARSCALSPDGSMAAAGFDDGSMKVECILHVKQGNDKGSSQLIKAELCVS